MNLRVLPAVVAVIFAFAVAMLAFVPFVAREYRRRGELGVTAAAVRSGVLVYLFGLLCYVLLPLPAPDFCSFVRVSPQWMLVSPEETGEQFCLNILLFVPLGMMLRGLGSRGRNTTVLIGFAVSLAIEVTQLTGTWFTYPCPYRVFDVEDLVANTFGTLVGSALVPFARRLATPRGDIPPTVARPITVSRRLLGMSCDGLLLWLLGVIGARVDLTWLRLPLPWQQSVALWLAPALVLLLVTVAGDGSTLGQHAVLVRSVDLSGSPCVRSVLTRWFTGIGGLALLETLANGLALSDTAATGLGVAWCTVHALGVAHQRRGISGWAAGLEVVDTARRVRASIRRHEPPETTKDGPVRHFDLVIIGTGSGNSILDERFADWDVAIIERGVFGGTCLNVGCIPTKMFVHTADIASAPAAGPKLGVDLALREVRWTEIRDRIFGRIDPIAAGGRRYRVEDNPNVTVYEGTGRFTGVKRLTVETANGTETITADRLVIAAGGRPTIPDIPGIETVSVHTSDTIMRLDELPSRLIILGTGFISAEFAHVFSSLGVDITVVGRSGRVLRGEDIDISQRFTEIAAERWDLRLNRTETHVETTGDTLRLHLDGPEGPEVLEAEELLVAVGRRPNTDLLDVAAGGLETEASGKIKVAATQAASVPGVWALGDISSAYELKHVANHEMRVVQHNLLHPDEPVESDHRFVPHAVFTAPQIASVGLTEQDAQARGVRYVTSTQDYAGIAYGWAMEDTTGFAKLLADPETGLLVGAHIIGPQAPTLIQPLVQAMHFGLDARSMARGQYWIHPAMPELIENALLNLPL